MRILYIINPGAEHRIYGSHRALLNLIEGITVYSDNTLAAVFPREGLIRKKLETMGVACYCPHRYRLTVAPSLKFEIYSIKSFLIFIRMLFERYRIQKDLIKIVDDFKPDLIHTNVGPLDIADKICREKKIPHIWHLREYQGNKSGMLTFFPSKKSYLNKIHSSNNYMIAITQGLFNHFDLKEKDTVIYDGVFDKKESNNSDRTYNGEYFLFVGRIDENKDILFLLRSYSKYVRNGGTKKLYLAGAAPSKRYFKQCEDFVSKNNIYDNVSFLGYRNDIYKLMQDSQALVVTSLFEGFGFITAEAMYNNCLVIGRDLTGTKEQFDNGLRLKGQEIAMRYNTEDELTHCLHTAELVNNRTMIENAFEVVNSLYSNQVHCKKVLSFYKEVLNE